MKEDIWCIASTCWGCLNLWPTLTFLASLSLPLHCPFSLGHLHALDALSSSKKSGRASEMFLEATYIWNNSPVSLTVSPEPHWFSLWYPVLPSDYSLTFNSDKLLLLLASLKNMPMPGEALLSISRPNRPWKLALLSPQTISPNLQRDSSSPVPWSPFNVPELTDHGPMLPPSLEFPQASPCLSSILRCTCPCHQI